MSFSRLELVELKSLLEEYDKLCWKTYTKPECWPRPSIEGMRKRVMEELVHAEKKYHGHAGANHDA